VSGRIGSLSSRKGSLSCCLWEDTPSFSTRVVSVRLDELQVGGENLETGWHSFVCNFGPDGLILTLPHWTLALVPVGLAVAPWLRWRFTTRTLLIAITAVAVVLGLIVWAIR
jgi:hypothetical protein